MTKRLRKRGENVDNGVRQYKHLSLLFAVETQLILPSPFRLPLQRHLDKVEIRLYQCYRGEQATRPVQSYN